MRRYAKDLAMMADSRRALEVQIRKEFPTMKPSLVRRNAKAFVLAAYKKLKVQEEQGVRRITDLSPYAEEIAPTLAKLMKQAETEQAQ
jgi:hypothetical protein